MMLIFKIIVTVLNILFAFVELSEFAKQKVTSGSEALGAFVIMIVFISSSALIWIK